MADQPVSLDAYRAARAAAATAKRVAPCYLAAAPDRVLLQLTDGAELDLSPEQAMVWSERLAAMADVARALGRDERALLGEAAAEDGGDVG